MKDRIIKIMEDYQLSSSQFADKIGVPRSGLSHVLKGRNKPSLDYVLKILESFPMIDSNWLLTGVEANFRPDDGNRDNRAANELEITNKANETRVKDSEIDKSVSNIDVNTAQSKEEVAPYYASKSADKQLIDGVKLDKIVMFYSDGSFKEYKREG